MKANVEAGWGIFPKESADISSKLGFQKEIGLKEEDEGEKN